MVGKKANIKAYTPPEAPAKNSPGSVTEFKSPPDKTPEHVDCESNWVYKRLGEKSFCMKIFSKNVDFSF